MSIITVEEQLYRLNQVKARLLHKLSRLDEDEYEYEYFNFELEGIEYQIAEITDVS